MSLSVCTTCNESNLFPHPSSCHFYSCCCRWEWRHCHQARVLMHIFHRPSSFTVCRDSQGVWKWMGYERTEDWSEKLTLYIIYFTIKYETLIVEPWHNCSVVGSALASMVLVAHKAASQIMSGEWCDVFWHSSKLFYINLLFVELLANNCIYLSCTTAMLKSKEMGEMHISCWCVECM